MYHEYIKIFNPLKDKTLSFRGVFYLQSISLFWREKMENLTTSTVTNSNLSLASSKEVLERIHGLQCLTSAASSTGAFINNSYANQALYKPAIKLGKGACTDGSRIVIPKSLLMEKEYDRASTIALLVHEMGHASFTYGVSIHWRDRDPVDAARKILLRNTDISNKLYLTFSMFMRICVWTI